MQSRSFAAEATSTAFAPPATGPNLAPEHRPESPDNESAADDDKLGPAQNDQQEDEQEAFVPWAAVYKTEAVDEPDVITRLRAMTEPDDPWPASTTIEDTILLMDPLMSVATAFADDAADPATDSDDVYWRRDAPPTHETATPTATSTPTATPTADPPVAVAADPIYAGADPGTWWPDTEPDATGEADEPADGESRVSGTVRPKQEPDVDDFGALVRIVRRYMQSSKRSGVGERDPFGTTGPTSGAPTAEPPLSDVAVSPSPLFPAPKLTLADPSKDGRPRTSRWGRNRTRSTSGPGATTPGASTAPATPRRSHRRQLTPTVRAALTLFVALVALGGGTLTALKLTGSVPEQTLRVGQCVAQGADRPAIVDCKARGAFEITEQLPRSQSCPEADQPFVLQGETLFCLAPVTASRRR